MTQKTLLGMTKRNALSLSLLSVHFVKEADFVFLLRLEWFIFMHVYAFGIVCNQKNPGYQINDRGFTDTGARHLCNIYHVTFTMYHLSLPVNFLKTNYKLGVAYAIVTLAY
ncbi:hypothetical protein PHYBLDRAFT_73496 [Phycomyces blakesleeanus NRRL 1555(-)]|uniref:Uncharacterized protein n=1 Tax=Phycomyces blakesleeanus (strain ATCC 8743b / DSM 1359 / FGSC 10004 / NBRC 33097 / NRRL 1555) TaxID=763407 RepID=A0A162N7J4_PHYB8|nr:hypothetical protein PHYBLDRAFT_73496 [Phycomyces blakesleeanus NRRL 1555(-)]OAD71858.1 hypothetical protein PHYBLDRAFT_73496 [Phycomyces blakesleeanus NRRL 1555(-)]|eukprot:XP_018289898.1 hypothetical protein PHYBLDRAFT_73496 [Phycomyces blakesleeanus NRRL 1555(-)]